MTSGKIAAAAGIVLSLLFSYVPGVSKWYNGLGKIEKQGTMGVALIAATAALFGLSCAGFLDAVTCDAGGAVAAIGMLIDALVANQATYLITPRKS